MPKIDKLKIEADVLKGYLFFVLGVMFSSLAGFFGLAIKLIEQKQNVWLIVLLVVLLFLLKVSAIIFLKIKENLKSVLADIEKE